MNNSKGSELAKQTDRAKEEEEYFEQMRKQCTRAVDFVTDYLQGISQYRVFPDIEPGFLRPLLPAEVPQTSESWDRIFEDVENILMRGVVHWHHPNFYAYIGIAYSYAALCADIIASAIGGVTFTWASSPVSTELEVLMLDWLAKLFALPEFYLSHTNGGGLIQGTSSECTFLALLNARNIAIEKYQARNPRASKFEIMERLVGYCSEEAHVCIERAGLLALLRIRSLPCNENFELDGQTLQQAIEQDLADGLIPFFCTATFGTTGTCSFDRVEELGPICQKYDLWLHLDAAYAGAALACPEFRKLMPGIEYTSSFTMNPYKMLLMNFDTSVIWFKDTRALLKTCIKDATYLENEKRGKMPDLKDWQIPFGCRFRSLKVWMVLRSYGVEGLQRHIRRQVAMAHYLESLILEDGRFDIIGQVFLGIVCFRLKHSNELTRLLHNKLKTDGRFLLVAGSSKHPRELYYIRVAIGYQFADEALIRTLFNTIVQFATDVIC